MLAKCEEEEVCIKIVQRLRAHFANPQFNLQLVGFIDLGKIFVEATYYIEGDGFLSIRLWSIIEPLLDTNDANYAAPNVRLVAQEMSEEEEKKHANVQHNKQPSLNRTYSSSTCCKTRMWRMRIWSSAVLRMRCSLLQMLDLPHSTKMPSRASW